ncbi:MAG: hypothetical protein QXN66_06795 [Thermoplasmatales archaeon]
MVDQFLLISSVAVLVSIFHMVAPDHWLPITIVSETNRFSRVKKYGVTASIGLLHGIFSSVIALAILYIGLLFLKRLAQYFEYGGLILLVIVGAYFLLNGFSERKSSNFAGNTSLVVSILPDFAIIPILLSASALSPYQLGIIISLFILVGTISLMGVVIVASYVANFALKRLNPAYFDYVIGTILFVTAATIYLEIF